MIQVNIEVNSFFLFLHLWILAKKKNKNSEENNEKKKYIERESTSLIYGLIIAICITHMYMFVVLEIGQKMSLSDNVYWVSRERHYVSPNIAISLCLPRKMRLLFSFETARKHISPRYLYFSNRFSVGRSLCFAICVIPSHASEWNKKWTCHICLHMYFRYVQFPHSSIRVEKKIVEH